MKTKQEIGLQLISDLERKLPILEQLKIEDELRGNSTEYFEKRISDTQKEIATVRRNLENSEAQGA